jgi:hypothetical protein
MNRRNKWILRYWLTEEVSAIIDSGADINYANKEWCLQNGIKYDMARSRRTTEHIRRNESEKPVSDSSYKVYNKNRRSRS